MVSASSITSPQSSPTHLTKFLSRLKASYVGSYRPGLKNYQGTGLPTQISRRTWSTARQRALGRAQVKLDEANFHIQLFLVKTSNRKFTSWKSATPPQRNIYSYIYRWAKQILAFHSESLEEAHEERRKWNHRQIQAPSWKKYRYNEPSQPELSRTLDEIFRLAQLSHDSRSIHFF